MGANSPAVVDMNRPGSRRRAGGEPAERTRGGPLPRSRRRARGEPAERTRRGPLLRPRLLSRCATSTG